jgi:hypothetical protein
MFVMYKILTSGYVNTHVYSRLFSDIGGKAKMMRLGFVKIMGNLFPNQLAERMYSWYM